MNNDPQDNRNNRRFSHGFNIGTTIQNVFRNINHAFSSNHNSSSGRQRSSDSRNHTDNTPPSEPLIPVGGRPNTRATHAANPSPSSPAPDTSIPSAFPPVDAHLPPPPRLDSQRDEDEDSMPELRSVTDSSDESDVSLAMPPRQYVHQVDDDRNSIWTDDGGDPPPLPPLTGIRRARVDDDGDDARDRRHPSERVGGPPPPGDTAPQNADPQRPPRPPAGLFGAVFGMGPPGGDVPHEHTHTGEGTADLLPTDINPTAGHVPRGAPILTAGFTLTIPLFGPPPGARMGPAAGGQGAAPGRFGMGMDAATREELFASFAAFFQEFHAFDETREDPERAKKLVAGLDVVPLGLVKRLTRIGGPPGGHVGDPNDEGSSSGCAICWDTLLDAEGDSFSGQQSSGEVLQSAASGPDTVNGHNETHAGGDRMDVDAPSVSAPHSEPETSPLTSPSSEAAMIISLPCAHVFHSSCLLPWFTRAKQATCPTCRFNIDPENLTYTPPLPGRVFNRAPPAQPVHAVPNPAPADPLAVPEVPLEVPIGIHAADAAAFPVDPVRATVDARPATAAMPPGSVPLPPTGQTGVPPAGLGFNPFVAMPGIPVLSFPAIQIPLRPTPAQTPGGGNQGIDVMTIGFDMFVGGPPPEERGGDPRDNAEGAEDAENAGMGAGAAGGNGAETPNGLAQDLHSLIEGLLRTTRNIIPQVINGQGPAPAPDVAPADGPQPQARPEAPETAGPQPPPPTGGPRIIPIFPLRPNMFRPTRSMPPRRDRKTWTLPQGPGPSLRQLVEEREREQGLRCSDTSCGVGPSDDDPYPEPSALSTKQVLIHPLPDPGRHKKNDRMPVCTHAFHPACLVIAERVAGWGGEDKMEPFVEVSCPVCRAVGCVTREEWESGVSAL